MDLENQMPAAGFWRVLRRLPAGKFESFRPGRRAGTLAQPYFVSRTGEIPGSESARIRLLQFLNNFHIGGTERQVVNLVSGLDRSRFDVEMGCFEMCGEFLDEIRPRDIPIKEFRINRLYNPRSMAARLELARHVRSARVDVVHSYGFYSNVFAVPAARLAGVPVVIASIRDTGETLSGVQKRVQQFFCRMAGCILANADGVRNWLIDQGYPAERIQVIRNGIELPPYRGRAIDAGLREELGFAPGTPLVAVLSRLNAMKGVEYFLEAASKVSVLFPKVRYLVVGDGEYRKELERYTGRLGMSDRVVFTGFRGDTHNVLSQVNISVLPSLSEGLSNSLLESMAAGTPVIATRVGGTPEAVEDGNTGLLVRPRDADALGRGMCLLLRNEQLAASFGEAARRRVAAMFSIEKMVRHTESLYVRLLNESRRGSKVVRPA